MNNGSLTPLGNIIFKVTSKKKNISIGVKTEIVKANPIECLPITLRYQSKNKSIAIYAPIKDMRATVHIRLIDTSSIGLIIDVSKENF
jgi:hypothetical protein